MKRKHCIKTKILSTILLILLLFSNISVLATSTQNWTTLAPMSTERFIFRTEVIDGKIYAIGGEKVGSVLRSIEVYNPTTNTWTTLAPMSTERVCFQTEVINGKIYAIGGSGRTSAPLSLVEVYNPTTNTWTTLAPMSKGRYTFQTEVIDGKIYAIGGTTFENTPLSLVEVYNPTTNTWTTLAPMSTERAGFRTEVIDGKIYAIGGVSPINGDSVFLSLVEVYNPTTNTWTTLESMSIPRELFQTEVIDGKIYAIGGETKYGVALPVVEVYNPTTDTWTTLESMTIPRKWFQTEVIEGKIYAIAGESNTSTAPYLCLASAEVYNPSTNKWTALESMTTSRRWPQTEVIGGKMYAIGGSIPSSGTLKSVECYTPVTSISDAPTNLTAAAGDSKVTLSWDHVSGASSYTVKRSTTPGGIYSTIFDGVTSTSYTDTDVTNGTTYYYVVTAISNGVESANSNEASATPTAGTTPTPPSDNNNALLRISMVNGEIKEYDMTSTEIKAFISWFNSEGASSPAYVIEKKYNLGPFNNRKEYIAYAKISSFEILEYNKK